MKVRQRLSDKLYYQSTLIPSPVSKRYIEEIKKIGFTTYESKRLLTCFEEWSKFVIFTNNIKDNYELRKTFLKFTFKKNKFIYTELMDNPSNHPMVRVFNLFVSFNNACFNVYESLVAEVDYCSASDTYDFRW